MIGNSDSRSRKSGSDENEYEGCCGPLSSVQIISVDGDQVGIIGLQQIVSQVKALGLSEASQITEELLERVERRNYVPSPCKEAYGKALWHQYLEKK